MKKTIITISLIALTSCSSRGIFDDGTYDKEVESIDKKSELNREKERVYLVEKDTAYLFSEQSLERISEFYNEDVNISYPPLNLTELISSMNETAGYKGKYVDNCLDDDDDDDDDSEEIIIPLTYSGNFSELLSKIGSIYDVSIKAEEYGYTAYSCEVELLPFKGITPDVTANLSAEEAESTSGTFTSEFDLSYQLKTDLMKEIEILLSKKGQASLNDATSHVLVSDKPSHVSKIKKLINQYNKKLEQQMLILVSVIRYSDSDVKQLGLDYDVALLDGSTSIIAGTNFTESLSGLNLQTTYDSSSTTTLFLKSYFDNINTILSTKADIITKNGVPTPLIINNNTDYISSISNERDDNNNRELRTIEVSTVTDGFNMILKATSIEDNEITITSLITQSETIALKSQEGITLPETTNRRFLQSFTVKSGDIIMLTSYEENSLTSGNSSTAPNTILFGGASSKGEKNRKILILIEPILI